MISTLLSLSTTMRLLFFAVLSLSLRRDSSVVSAFQVGSGAVSVRPSGSATSFPVRVASSLALAASEEEAGGDRRAAEDLLARARKIRASLPEEAAVVAVDPAPTTTPDDDDVVAVPYRLYLDLGREPGTWMDVRWGASGARIEAAIDVRFVTGECLDDRDVRVKNMVKDNFGSKSSRAAALSCDGPARLRGGFDAMGCDGGAYRLDRDNDRRTTVRFYLEVAGTKTGADNTYGDVSVPPGRLYFSIPCFGNDVSNLSAKEGPVTVRQQGWHTGFWREESRIVGVFKAVPLEKARARDKY